MLHALDSKLALHIEDPIPPRRGKSVIYSKPVCPYKHGDSDVRSLGYSIPSPAQAMQLYIALAEDTLEKKLKTPVFNMLVSGGEWYNVAAKIHDGNLVVYKNISHNDFKGVTLDEHLLSNRCMTIALDAEPGEKISGQSMHKRSPQVIEYFCGRSFDNLPLDIAKNLFFIFPEYPKPLARSNENFTYGFEPGDLRTARGFGKREPAAKPMYMTAAVGKHELVYA
jgi:hypothetical protein